MEDSLKSKIMAELGKFHRKQGVAFLSQEDAEDYFRGLVELIEKIIIKYDRNT